MNIGNPNYDNIYEFHPRVREITFGLYDLQKYLFDLACLIKSKRKRIDFKSNQLVSDFAILNRISQHQQIVLRILRDNQH